MWTLQIERETFNPQGMKYPWTELVTRVSRGLRHSPAVVLLGPRQCGKSTLAHALTTQRGGGSYFDLEDPADLQALAEPMTTLSPLRGLVVIDEVQRRPELFPVLRVLLDRRPVRTRFLILSSAAPELLRQSSETLAGRVTLVEMTGFHAGEVGAQAWRRLWLRGGFPEGLPGAIAAGQPGLAGRFHPHLSGTGSG